MSERCDCMAGTTSTEGGNRQDCLVRVVFRSKPDSLDDIRRSLRLGEIGVVSDATADMPEAHRP